MRGRSIAVATMLAVILVVVGFHDAAAQRPQGSAVEVATLAGITILKSTGGNSLTELGIPSGASAEALLPSLRLSFWTPSAVTIETAISFVRLSSEGASSTLFLFEAGPSFALPSGGSTLASIGGVAGVISATNGSSESDFYVGPQVIMRSRLRDYAVARFQGGVRFFMSDDFGLDYSIEVAGGVGFFL